MTFIVVPHGGRDLSTRSFEISYRRLRVVGTHGVLAEEHEGVEADLTLVGKPHKRIDAIDAVPARKQFAMDLAVPDALPTMVCRAPDLNGTATSIRNEAVVKAMPGVTHVAIITTGVAVRAKTFGQCIDAVRALDVEWKAGTVPGKKASDILTELRAAQLPLAVPKLGASSVESEFVFHFRSGSALEPNCAVADVREEVQMVVTDTSGLTKGRDFNVLSYKTWRVGDIATKHQLIKGGLGWGGLPASVAAGQRQQRRRFGHPQRCQPRLGVGLVDGHHGLLHGHCPHLC